MSATADDRTRRLGGWGFTGETFTPSPEMLAWLEERIGPPEGPFPAFDAGAQAAPATVALPDLGIPASRSALDRLAHARGQGLPDLLRLRSGDRSRHAGRGRPSRRRRGPGDGCCAPPPAPGSR